MISTTTVLSEWISMDCVPPKIAGYAYGVTACGVQTKESQEIWSLRGQVEANHLSP